MFSNFVIDNTDTLRLFIKKHVQVTWSINRLFCVFLWRVGERPSGIGGVVARLLGREASDPADAAG